jgi:hypothetical protein
MEADGGGETKRRKEGLCHHRGGGELRERAADGEARLGGI